MEPSLGEYIASNQILFGVLILLIGFAVFGIFTVVEEIRFRIARHRYRKARDERRKSKWTKRPRDSGKV